MTARGRAIAALILVAAATAGAQGNRQGACRVDTTADWYRSQKAFYSGANETWSDDSLRRALMSAAGYDPTSAFIAELGFRITGQGAPVATDAGVVALLKEMAQKRQWPTRALVGTAGVHAAWLIAQRDSTLEIAAMRRMMEAGPGESSSAEVAVLDDARRIRVGRGQIHGTQFAKSPNGGVVIAGRIEDSVHVDMRREGAWLPPIALSACLAARAAGGR